MKFTKLKRAVAFLSGLTMVATSLWVTPMVANPAELKPGMKLTYHLSHPTNSFRVNTTKRNQRVWSYKVGDEVAFCLNKDSHVKNGERYTVVKENRWNSIGVSETNAKMIAAIASMGYPTRINSKQTANAVKLLKQNLPQDKGDLFIEMPDTFNIGGEDYKVLTQIAVWCLQGQKFNGKLRPRFVDSGWGKKSPNLKLYPGNPKKDLYAHTLVYNLMQIGIYSGGNCEFKANPATPKSTPGGGKVVVGPFKITGTGLFTTYPQINGKFIDDPSIGGKVEQETTPGNWTETKVIGSSFYRYRVTVPKGTAKLDYPPLVANTRKPFNGSQFQALPLLPSNTAHQKMLLIHAKPARPFTMPLSKVPGDKGSSKETEIFKADEEGNPIPNVEIIVKDLEHDNIVYSGTTGPDGIVKFIQIKEKGRFLVTETKPPQGYEPGEYVTGKEEVLEPGKRLTIVNKKPKEKLINLKAKKVDAKDGSPLKGATFELYMFVNGEWLPQEDKVTDETGYAVFENYPPNQTYKIIEISGPEGYFFDGDNMLTETIQAGAHSLNERVFKNIKIENKEIKLRIVKQDGDSKTPLPGAEFTLSGMGKSETKTTEGDGTVEFTGLKKGKYTIIITVF